MDGELYIGKMSIVRCGCCFSPKMFRSLPGQDLSMEILQLPRLRPWTGRGSNTGTVVPVELTREGDKTALVLKPYNSIFPCVSLEPLELA